MVIFDAGGTLFGVHERAPFQRFLAQAGLPASDKDAEGFHQRLISVVIALRDQAQGLGADGAELDRWWRTIFRQTWPDRPEVAEEMLRWLRAGRLDRLFADVVGQRRENLFPVAPSLRCYSLKVCCHGWVSPFFE